MPHDIYRKKNEKKGKKKKKKKESHWKEQIDCQFLSGRRTGIFFPYSS